MKHKLRKLLAMIMTLCMIIPVLATGAVATDTPFSDIAGHWAENTITRWADIGIVNGYPDGTFKPDEPITRAELAKIVTLAFGLTEKTATELNGIDPNEWYYNYVLTAADFITIQPMSFLPEELHFYRVNRSGANEFFPNEPALRYQAAEAFVQLKIYADGGLTIELPETDNTQTLTIPQSDITVEVPSAFDIFMELRETFNDSEIGPQIMMLGPGRWDTNQMRNVTFMWLAYELGIMQGEIESDGRYFHPNDSLTRAEVLTIIDRILTPEEAAENMIAAEAALDKPAPEPEPEPDPEPDPEPVEVILPDGTVPESIDLADPKYNITMTRAQFAELLTVAFDLDGETSLALTDVEPNSEYYSYIKAAADYIPKFTGYEMRTEVDAYYQAQNQSRYDDFLPDETILRMHASQSFTDIYELLYGVDFTVTGGNTDLVLEMTEHYSDTIINDIQFQSYMGRGVPPSVIYFRDAIYSGFKLGIMNDRIGADGLTYFLPYDALTLSDALYSIFKLLPSDDAEVFASELDSLSFMQA